MKIDIGECGYFDIRYIRNYSYHFISILTEKHNTVDVRSGENNLIYGIFWFIFMIGFLELLCLIDDCNKIVRDVSTVVVVEIIISPIINK